jgi:hypothetical protein
MKSDVCLSCLITLYTGSTSNFHSNALSMFVEKPSEQFLLWTYYGSLVVEEKHEEYMYGFDTAIVAVGGSMGLYLGYSCLSISQVLMDKIESSLIVQTIM